MAKYTVARSHIIQSNKETLFSLVSDLAKASTYEPWQLSEPSLSVQYSEKTAEVGSWYAWEGKIIGHGRMEIIEIFKGEQGLQMKLDFFTPRKSLGNIVEYYLEEQQEPNTCKVTWSMTMHLPWFLTPFLKSIRTSIDGWLGPHFELGLKRLAHLANADAPVVDIVLQDSKTIDTIYYIGSRFTQASSSDMEHLCGKAYPKLADILKHHNLEEKSAFIKYTRFNKKTKKFDGCIALEINEKDRSALANITDDSVEIGTIPTQYYSVFHHIGWYDTLMYGWLVGAVRSMSLQSKEDKKKSTLEIFRTMPNGKPGLTEICFPINKEKEQKVVYS